MKRQLDVTESSNGFTDEHYPTFYGGDFSTVSGFVYDFYYLDNPLSLNRVLGSTTAASTSLTQVCSHSNDVGTATDTLSVDTSC